LALDGGVLVDCFTPNGVGTMITTENFASMREATIDDVGGLLNCWPRSRTMARW